MAFTQRSDRHDPRALESSGSGARKTPAAPTGFHPSVVDRPGANGLVEASLLLDLQRTAGNVSTTSLVKRQSDRQGFAPERSSVVVQRNVLSHVAPEDPQFWNTLKGQVKSDYALWLGEFDRTFRGFVSVMGKTSSVKDMFLESIFENWISIGTGTYGAVSKSFLASVRLLMTSKSTGSKSTLGELEKETIDALNLVTEKVRNTDSDLTIYLEIDRQTAAERSHASSGPQPQEATRLAIREELANSLEQLPQPDRIEQDLTKKWMELFDKDNPSSPMTVVFEIEYDLRKEPWQYNGFSTPWLAGPGDLQTTKNTIEALRDGFSTTYELSNLPVRLWVKVIEITPVKYEESARNRTELGVYVKEGGSWKVESVTGIYSDGQDESRRKLNLIIADWLGGGKVPTLADLVPSDRDSKQLEDLYTAP